MKVQQGGERFLEAWMHMREALKMLDQAAAPADIGAHLDLAMCRLQEVLDSDDLGTSVLESLARGPRSTAA